MYGFTVSSSATTVLGFSFTGDTIPTGCGTLTILELDGEPSGLYNIIMSDASGNSLDFSYYDSEGDDGGDDGSCDDEDNDGICDDVDDCVGIYDECGICNGDGSSCQNYEAAVSFGELGGQILTVLELSLIHI